MKERGKKKQGKSVWSPSTIKDVNWPHFSDVTGSVRTSYVNHLSVVFQAMITVARDHIF